MTRFLFALLLKPVCLDEALNVCHKNKFVQIAVGVFMRPGRELDAQVAAEIFGHDVFAQNSELLENTENGPSPLRAYSSEMGMAWMVAEKMRISLMPVDNGNWFAFAGPVEGWTAPEAFLEYLKAGDFTFCGASVGKNAAQAVCEAALVAQRKRNLQSLPPQSATKPILVAVSDTSVEDSDNGKKPPNLH